MRNKIGTGVKKVVGVLSKGFDYVGRIREDAEAAWNSTDRVYIPRLPLPSGDLGNVRRWVDYVEAIEDVGWVMDTWAVTSNDRDDSWVVTSNDGNGSMPARVPVAVPLFRRP